MCVHESLCFYLQSHGEHDIESNTINCDDATRTINSSNKSLCIAHEWRREKATKSHTNVSVSYEQEFFVINILYVKLI